jgi:mevalonate kinase
MKRFYSHGKLLLAGEYLVLKGGLALGLPTRLGQDLKITAGSGSHLIWESYDPEGCWLRAEYDVDRQRIVSATSYSREEKVDQWAERLFTILLEAGNLNPDFLTTLKGSMVKTRIGFPKEWGLGSSSSLVNNLASWAGVDAYKLLDKTFGGSGYDVACAQHGRPLLFRRTTIDPEIGEIEYDPKFSDKLFFVYLNRKQSSREAVRKFMSDAVNVEVQRDRIDGLIRELIAVKNLNEFNGLLNEHERILSALLDEPTVKENLFPDYSGTVKSLGAWGGDFILATGEASEMDYFRQKGFQTVIPYDEMIHKQDTHIGN